MLFQLDLDAQNTILQTDNDKYFRDGLDLFDKQQYAAARTSFEEYMQFDPQSIKAVDAKYYIAISAMSLYHNDGEFLLDQFVNQHEGHPKSVYAYYELGNFYFKNKDYTQAITYLKKTDINKLTSNQRMETRFKLGYAYFTQKKFGQALSYFNNVKKGKGEYTAAANYYAGFIEFKNGSYDAALVDLKNAEKNEAYAAIVPYMILNVYYKQERYDHLLAYGEQVVASGRKVKNLEDFSLLIAESYFRKQKFHKAADFFQTYVDSQKSKDDDEVKYRLAYAYYNMAQFEKAEQYFKEIAPQNNTIGQSASYYLGNLYLQQDNKQFAFTAFENAGKMDFDKIIQEESLFKQAKISYDRGDFDEAIDALNTLATTFPESERANEANVLLSEAYLNTSDYNKAIEHIEKINNKSERVKKTYQQVTYFKGTENFNKGKYYQAVQLFRKSLQHPEDEDLAQKANFWAGEAFSIGKKYPEAIKRYQAVLNSGFSSDTEAYLRAKYGLSYVYYNSKQYGKALSGFSEFLSQPKAIINKQFYDDALIRLADCYYVNKSYDQAIVNYQKAITNNNPDLAYAYFQKAVILGLQNNVSQAKSNFDVVISKYPGSTYMDNAMYQKAQLEFEQGDYVSAEKGFGRLISRKPQSSFIPYALLKRGLANYNLKKFNVAANDYKRVLNEFPSHEAAYSAISALQEVLTAQNKSTEFDKYLSRYKASNPDNSSLQNIEFETAKNIYNNQKYQQAISSFEKYINNYPGTANSHEAKFFIAESYFRLNQDSRALTYYYQIEQDGISGRTSKVIQRIADLEYKHGNYDKAVTYFRKLADIARNKRQRYTAWSGLMKTYYHKANYNAVKENANLVLEKGNISADAANKATLYLGKAEYALGNSDTAVDHFMNTLNAAKDENGAEAQYLLGMLLYEQGEYKRSIENLIDLNGNFGGYELWVGKSFLLIADNYIGLKEYFQAEATLNSIIDKSPVEQIVGEAKIKLQQLKTLNANAPQQLEEVESDTTFQEFGN